MTSEINKSQGPVQLAYVNGHGYVPIDIWIKLKGPTTAPIAKEPIADIIARGPRDIKGGDDELKKLSDAMETGGWRGYTEEHVRQQRSQDIQL